MVTDIGIELGKIAYVNRRAGEPPVRGDLAKLWMLAAIVGLFFVAGCSAPWATSRWASRCC